MYSSRLLVAATAWLNLYTRLTYAQGSPACPTQVVSEQINTGASGVQLQSYSYCDGNLGLKAFIENRSYNKIITVFYTNTVDDVESIGLGYDSAIDGTNWELWTAQSAAVNGINSLLNLTYVNSDSGEVLAQDLDIAVDGTTVAPVPVPYARPSGLAEDITQWLAASPGSQISTCRSKMLANINPPGAAEGTVVASTSTESPNYAYNWVRDAALTMDVVVKLYAAASDAGARSFYETILFQYAQARADEQNDPNLQTGLGEPKFELNNTVFTGPWGRPQNDGPAESASTLLDFAQAYLANGGDLQIVRERIWDSNNFGSQAPVLKDLQFVASNWSSPSFDLWEEVSGDHFFNRMVSHRALTLGAAFASNLSDGDTAGSLSGAAQAVSTSLSTFWDSSRQLIVYEVGDVLLNKTSYKDIAVVLGVLHGNVDGSPFSPSNDQVLASAYQIATSFIPVYPIANTTENPEGQILGLPVGRYPEDVYTGTGTAPDGGNPWYLATAAMSELFFLAARDIQQQGSFTVTDASLLFWQYFAPDAALASGRSYATGSAGYDGAIAALLGWADAFMRRIRYHTPSDQRLSEQYQRATGNSTGANDLTWSYASILTAAFARSEISGDTGYVAAVANLA